MPVHRVLAAFLIAASLLSGLKAAAQTPQGTAFTYQGVVKQNGVALNGNADMTFALFDAATNGNPIGSPLSFTAAGSNPVNVQNGVFEVTLDFGPMAFMALANDQRFLQVTVNGTALTPRTPIQNAPYALQSQTAELAYTVSNASIGTAQIIPAQVQNRIGGTCASGSAISAVNQNGGVTCQSTGAGTITSVAAGRGLSGGGTSGDVTLGIADPLSLTGNDGGTGVINAQNTGNGYGVYGAQNVGPYGAGVRGDGVYYGVWGFSPEVVGVHGESTGLTGAGVEGIDSSGGWGVYGESPHIGVIGTGPNGGATQAAYGIYGVGQTGVAGNGATGVYGTGSSYAVYADLLSSVTSGFGVYAYSRATSGTSNGVYGESDSPGGVGVSGYSGPGIGVAGSTSSGLAGKFIGNVSVTGSLSKGGGSFKIDHPLDPANQYLYHSFVESPDMKNIYDGIATLDATGAASVELPGYFEALNRDFRYQLTALGRPAPALYVSDEISGNRFRIAGGNPGQRISWQVTGTRHDAWANAHRIPVEVPKSPAARGKFLYPVELGQPEAMAIDRRGSAALPVSPKAVAAPTSPAPPSPQQ